MSGFVDVIDRREIPNAELLVLEEADHYAAHVSQDDQLLDAVLRTLRAA